VGLISRLRASGRLGQIIISDIAEIAAVRLLATERVINIAFRAPRDVQMKFQLLIIIIIVVVVVVVVLYCRLNRVNAFYRNRTYFGSEVTRLWPKLHSTKRCYVFMCVRMLYNLCNVF